MANIRNRKCTHHGCSNGESFTVAGMKMAEFSDHRKDGMVDLASRRRCIYVGCNRWPRYGVAGGKEKKVCAEHKNTVRTENVIDSGKQKRERAPSPDHHAETPLQHPTGTTRDARASVHTTVASSPLDYAGGPNESPNLPGFQRTAMMIRR